MKRFPMTKHHRKPRSLMNGETIPGNVVKVPENKHAAYHLLFGNWTPEQIAEELNRVWIDQDFKMVAIKK